MNSNCKTAFAMDRSIALAGCGIIMERASAILESRKSVVVEVALGFRVNFADEFNIIIDRFL